MHGPLLVVLVAEAIREWSSRVIADLTYRLRAPAFVHEPLQVVGEPDGDAVDVRVATSRHDAHLTARVTLR